MYLCCIPIECEEYQVPVVSCSFYLLSIFLMLWYGDALASLELLLVVEAIVGYLQSGMVDLIWLLGYVIGFTWWEGCLLPVTSRWRVRLLQRVSVNLIDWWTLTNLRCILFCSLNWYSNSVWTTVILAGEDSCGGFVFPPQFHLVVLALLKERKSSHASLWARSNSVIEIHELLYYLLHLIRYFCVYDAVKTPNVPQSLSCSKLARMQPTTMSVSHTHAIQTFLSYLVSPFYSQLV